MRKVKEKLIRIVQWDGMFSKAINSQTGKSGINSSGIGFFIRTFYEFTAGDDSEVHSQA